MAEEINKNIFSTLDDNDNDNITYTIKTKVCKKCGFITKDAPFKIVTPNKRNSNRKEMFQLLIKSYEIDNEKYNNIEVD